MQYVLQQFFAEIRFGRKGILLFHARSKCITGFCIREDRNLTQADIGTVLNKSQQGYNHIETGRAELGIEDLVTLCRFYDLSADYITGLVNTPTSFRQKENRPGSSGTGA